MAQDNLTNQQSDYAIYLPALSGFYATFIGKQRDTANGPYVEPTRFPQGITDMEQLNWLNSQKGLFTYKWSLYSAGHANLDTNKQDWGEDMIRTRDRANTFVLGDSGGFQIGKGVWEGDWRANSGCLKAEKYRSQVLTWMDTYMDYGMCLDIPGWIFRNPGSVEKTKISSYEEAVEATKYNNEYFIKHRTGACKFLNVLQGENHIQADDWYQKMKDFCDPKKYDKPFNGWAMGGQNMCDFELVLRRIVKLIEDKLLEPGQHDWMHFLGVGRLDWATLLTDIQRAVRKYHNPNFTISFDCASPFLATANGQVYHEIYLQPNGKWSYRMTDSIDDKKYATDVTPYKDVFIKEKGVKFDESPVSKLLKIKDICIYKPGDLNKIGKEGKTSWDSFSYALLMSHNVWLHIASVQKANRRYFGENSGNIDLTKRSKVETVVYDLDDPVRENDDGRRFSEMTNINFLNKKTCRISRGDEEKEILRYKNFSELINDIIKTASEGNFSRARKIIRDHDRFWTAIIGSRGTKGNNQINAGNQYNNIGLEVISNLDGRYDMFDEEAYERLAKLESGEELDKKGPELELGLFEGL